MVRMAVTRRIIKELERLLQNQWPDIIKEVVLTDPQNRRYLTVYLHGPPGSYYENGIFVVEMFLTQNYPMSPPRVRFMTPIWHPNIDRIGRISLDVLSDRWSPALTTWTILLSLSVCLRTYIFRVFCRVPTQTIP